ncbi:hypothetical protein B0H14DRAFT_2564980 [Mycena olivaceomarginata]|nr:hypothetical protein B0H14DRAFT_2600977 [Mycena olivaceomarginata]KAJ7883183.1 hypothetical protein B0H14DRAFT_2564980 [Mycena olivaceomarginata]
MREFSKPKRECVLELWSFRGPQSKAADLFEPQHATGRKVKAMVHVESEDAGSTKRKGSLWFNDSRECWEAFSGPAVEFEPESGFDDGPGSNEPRYNLSRLDETEYTEIGFETWWFITFRRQRNMAQRMAGMAGHGKPQLGANAPQGRNEELSKV